LERIKKASDGFTNALAITASAVTWLLVVDLQVIAPEGLLANDRECAIIASIDILNEHADRTSQRSDFCLEIYNAVGGFVVHSHLSLIALGNDFIEARNPRPNLVGSIGRHFSIQSLILCSVGEAPSLVSI